jgi:hypothetical protein
MLNIGVRQAKEASPDMRRRHIRPARRFHLRPVVDGSSIHGCYSLPAHRIPCGLDLALPRRTTSSGLFEACSYNLRDIAAAGRERLSQGKGTAAAIRPFCVHSSNILCSCTLVAIAMPTLHYAGQCLSTNR